jgi:hypothetical protein
MCRLLVKVTPQTYIRAETDRIFHNLEQMAGGVNRLFHLRAPLPLDKQDVVRMNLDTLYSVAIVDTQGGATLTLPPVPKRRFMSALVIDNDHYAPAVYYKPGTYQLPGDTKYVQVVIRVQVNVKDPADVAVANQLQDNVVIQAHSAEAMPPDRWDPASLDALRAQYEREASAYRSFKGMMGPRGSVDENTRHIAAAAAWGLNPETDATYLNYAGNGPASRCYTATYRVPPNDAFWSITVYGNDGYIKSDNALLNENNVKFNGDGTFTVYFGSEAACGSKPNRLDITPGWNFLMRVYRPGEAVLDGSYKLPNAVPVKRAAGKRRP